jgi:Mg2+-importing ATPase
MVGFGFVSSIFDFVTFGALLLVFHADAATFQTAWFVESLLTELAVVAVMRTQKPFLRSRPSALLVWTSISVAIVAVALPYVPPVREALAFASLPPLLLASIFGIVGAYVAVSETLKRWIGVLEAGIRV